MRSRGPAILHGDIANLLMVEVSKERWWNQEKIWTKKVEALNDIQVESDADLVI